MASKIEVGLLMKATADMAEAEKAFGGLTGALGKVGSAATGASKVVGAGMLAGGAAIAGFAGMAIASASDINESQNKVNVVFGDSAKAINDLAATSGTALGQTKGQVLEAAGTFGNLLVSLGATQDSAAGMSVDMVKLASDLGSFNNADPTEVLEALRSGLSGEAEPMKRFGVALNDVAMANAAVKAGLIESVDQWGSYGKSMTESEKMQLRYNIIMEQTKTAQGDFANTSSGMANSMKIIKSSLQDAVGEIGAGLLPAVEKAAGAFKTFLQSEKFDEFKNKIIELFTTVGDKLASLNWESIADTVAGVFGKITGAITFLSEHPGIAKFIALAAGIVAAIAPIAAIIGPIIPVVMSLGSAFGALAGLAPALGAAFAVLTGPIGLVVAAIAAVIAIGVLLYKHWDDVKAAAAALGAWLATKWTEMTTAITGAMAAIWTAVSTKWTEIKTSISSTIENIRVGISEGWDRITEYLAKVLEDIRASIQAKWDAAKALIEGAMTAIRDGVQAAWDAIKTAIDSAVEFIRGIIQTALNRWQSIFETVAFKIQSIVDSVFGENSGISKVIDTCIQFVLGIFETLRKFVSGDVGGAFENLKLTVSQAITGLKDAVKTGIENAVKFFQPILDKIKELTGIDLAKIGRDIIQGLADGIDAGVRFVTGALGRLADLLPQWLKDALGMHSPPEWARDIGRDIVKGMAEGIEGASFMVRDAIAAVAESAIGYAQQLPALFGGGASGQLARGLRVGGSRMQLVASEWMTQGLGMGVPGGLGIQTPALGSTYGQTIADLGKTARALGDAVGDLSRSIIDWRGASMELAGQQRVTAGSFQSLLDKIKSSPWIGLGGDLKKWAKEQGFDEETVEGIGDLHTMRGPKGWKTDWARELFERRRSGRSYGRSPWQASTYGETGFFTGDTVSPEATGLGGLGGLGAGRVGAGMAAGTAMVQAQDVTVAGVSGGKVNFNDMSIDHVAIAMPAVSVTVSGREIATAMTMDPTALAVLVNGVAAKLARAVTITP